MGKKNKKIDLNNYILVDETENWLLTEIPSSFCDSEFMQIIIFYVLHSPCKQGSYSPVPLDKYGWTNPWHSKKFKDTLRNIASFNDETYQYTESHEKFKELWESTEIQNNFYDLCEGEFAIFSHVGETNPFLDLFHHIRNAIAHGRFTAKKHNHNFYIYMEDAKTVRGKIAVNARIMLKKSTLIKWIDMIEAGPLEENSEQTNQ